MIYLQDVADMIHLNCEGKPLKKKVILCEQAETELLVLPILVRKKFKALLLILAQEGFLLSPDSKKFKTSGLFEIRIRIKGQWRALYAYLQNNNIIILRIFHKKTQKTPPKELEIAKKRLKFLK